MSTPWVFHCLNVKLAQDWQGTCQEYTNHVRSPFSSIPFVQLFRCTQSNWGDAFREWGILQLYLGVTIAVVCCILDFIDHPARVLGNLVELVVQIAVAYVFAHLAWYGVVKRTGCFCCIIACCECVPILLLWGVCMMFWGIFSFIASFHGISDCDLCWIKPILQAIHATILFYMGMCCVRIWLQHGSQIVPPEVDVAGPEGKVVGRAVVASQ
eukprot:TRINITY_DN111726_c0_g1_i1.p1 TRINITY_DN111726_c0_g1~~TRINITY_DN111726_c0_g1_i1.p1  ORF type:complete len:237 (-),score=8.60 TRINITY_DN111726_c0_g1_i1:320-955(-)